MYIDLYDWEQFYSISAESQGWRIVDVGPRGNPEIILDIVPHSNEKDSIRQFKNSYQKGEAHAITAYSIIKRDNPREFAHWNMASW